MQAPHAQKGATTVYATIMAWPAAGSFTFKALAKSPDCGKVKAVHNFIFFMMPLCYLLY